MPDRKPVIVVTILFCLLASPVGAEPATGGVRIEGSVGNQTTVRNSANVASGQGARAVTTIGSIGSGVRIRGDLNLTVDVEEVTTLADGPDHRAVTSVGSIHPDAAISGRREVVVSTGKIVNMTESGDVSCVIVGSVGALPGC